MSKVYSRQFEGYRVEWDWDCSYRVWTVYIVDDEDDILDTTHVPSRRYLDEEIAYMTAQGPKELARKAARKAEYEERMANSKLFTIKH